MRPDMERRRAQAGWIDVLLLFIVGLIVSLLAGQSHIGSWTTTTDGSVTHNSGAQVNLTGGPFLLWCVIALLYYFVAELVTGQTLGKRLLGLRVTTLAGEAPGARAVLLRTIGRIVDVLPAFYLVGWVTMRRSRGPMQRVGDRLAGTTVTTR